MDPVNVPAVGSIGVFCPVHFPPIFFTSSDLFTSHNDLDLDLFTDQSITRDLDLFTTPQHVFPGPLTPCLARVK